MGLLDEAAARLGLEMVRDRNLTVHTYNERLADEIHARLQAYLEHDGVLAHAPSSVEPVRGKGDVYPAASGFA